MKLQLDTNLKTIKVEESVNLGELMEAIEKLLPNWKEFKIEPTVMTEFVNPIVIDRYRWPIRPYWYDHVTVGSGFNHRNGERSLTRDITYQSDRTNIYNFQIE